MIVRLEKMIHGLLVSLEFGWILKLLLFGCLCHLQVLNKRKKSKQLSKREDFFKGTRDINSLQDLYPKHTQLPS